MREEKITSIYLAQTWKIPLEVVEELMRQCGIPLVAADEPWRRESIQQFRRKMIEKNQKVDKATKNENLQQSIAPVEKEQEQWGTLTNVELQNPEMQKLREYVKQNYIFIDTCSLFAPSCMDFLNRLIPMLRQEKKRLYIPSRVVNELKKVSDTKPEYKPRYGELKKLIVEMYEEGIVSLRGEESDNFADNVFLTQFTRYRMEYPLLLITQDRRLASDILNLNNIRSQKGYPVAVQRVSSQGYLENVPPPPDDRKKYNRNRPGQVVVDIQKQENVAKEN